MADLIPQLKYRTYLIISGTERLINPLGVLSVTWELVEGTFYYEPNIGSFKLTKDDYRFIKEVEEGGICNTVIIRVDRKCGNTWSEYATAEFTVQSCKFDDAICNVTVNPVPSGLGKCLVDRSGEQLDMFKEVVSVGGPGVDGFALMSDQQGADTLNYGNGKMFFYTGVPLHSLLIRPEFVDAAGNPALSGTPTLAPTEEELLATGTIGLGEEGLIRITRIGRVQTGVLNNPYIIYVAWAYRRSEAKVGGICPVTPNGYTLIDDTGVNCTYQKKPTDSDMSVIAIGAGPTSNFGDCTVIAPAGPNDSSIYSGALAGTTGYAGGFCCFIPHKDTYYSYLTLSLKRTLEVFVDKCNDSKDPISDFFQINPENPSTINYVTGLTSVVDDIRFIQQSNAIFPLLANAKKGLMSFNDLSGILKEAFQAFWTIDSNGNLRYEHFSYFENVNIGLDLTVPKFAKYVNGKIQYSYKRAELPFIEQVADDGNHINYNWDDREIKYVDTNDNKLQCVGNNTVNRSFGIFTTDLDFYLEYPTGISRQGWVMVSCVIPGAGSPEVTHTDNLPNGWMSIKRLVENYYNQGRSAINAKINDVDKVFDSTVRLKLEDSLSVPLCCADEFNPTESIKTPLGIGRVQSAEHNLKTEKLTLKSEY